MLVREERRIAALARAVIGVIRLPHGDRVLSHGAGLPKVVGPVH